MVSVSTITDIFNTREIVIAILFFSLIIFALYKSSKDIIDSFKSVLEIFFSKKIITPILIMFFYSLILIYILNIVGLWENHQIKNYIYWLIGVGVITHFKQNSFSIKSVLKDTLSLIVIFQFILTFYTFNLFFELIFISIVSFLSMAKVVIDKEDTKALNSFIDILLSIFGFILIFLTAKEYLNNFNEFANSKTLYDFFVPTFLSIMAIPYFYLFFTIVTYESSFVSLNYAVKDKNLLRYAKLKGIFAFNFDSKSFQKWSHNLFSYDISKDSIKKSIQDIKKLNQLKKNIYEVDIKKGWHPFIANSFLIDSNVEIKDYRRSYSDTWSGTSNYLRISEEFSHIFYRIEGKVEYVNKLELQLFFYKKDKLKIEKSYNLFVNMCNDLTIKSLKNELPKDVLNSLIGDNDLTKEYYNKKFVVSHQSFETSAYQVIFTIH
ncbi:Uncharacterised protein [Aliarcobacter skirrowii]|uniref:Membrane protein n=2 Tax=Aliarcobacter skirrowii TaxID=28200 RepID=A0AAD0SKV5_9BACT|nr:putative membrane protein [Aliarcobacter skirrowii CCUG 10374]RXI24710.1 hypothetical protein CP959_09745 [Aliarcobacter skirrowii CCUG 10374]SUV14772.1 Uncharacterised protein [Aliarcobacter skirrowii]